MVFRTLPLVCVLLLNNCAQRAIPELPKFDSSQFETDVRAAVDHALTEAKSNAKDVDPVLRLAMVLHAHEQFQAAGQCYARAHALAPKRFDALYLLAHTLASKGEYRQAAERLRQALAIRVESVPALLKLADVLRESGDAAKSAELYKRVLQLSPDDARAHYGLGRALGGDKAVEEFEKALALFPRFGAAQFALAAEHRRRGAEAKAQDLLRHYERDKTLLPPLEDPEMRAVRAFNVSTNMLLQRAGEQQAEGRFEEAAALYQRAIAGNTSEPEAYYNFGVFCFERGRLDDAKKNFERAVQLKPKHAEALNNLGAILEQEGKLEQAAALYRRAVESKPDYPLAHFHLGRIYANQRKYAQAIGELERSLEPATPSTPAYLYALGATHARAGHRARAAELMRSARSQASAQGQGQLVASIDRDLAILERKP